MKAERLFAFLKSDSKISYLFLVMQNVQKMCDQHFNRFFTLFRVQVFMIAGDLYDVNDTKTYKIGLFY